MGVGNTIINVNSKQRIAKQLCNVDELVFTATFTGPRNRISMAYQVSYK